MSVEMEIAEEDDGFTRCTKWSKVNMFAKRLDGFNLDDNFKTSFTPTEQACLLRSQEMASWHTVMKGLDWK
jgi:hypothetical protein